MNKSLIKKTIIITELVPVVQEILVLQVTRRNPGHVTSAQQLNASDALAAPVNTSDSNTDHSPGTKASKLRIQKKRYTGDNLISYNLLKYVLNF